MPYLNKSENKNAYILSGNSVHYVEPRTMQNYFKRILKGAIRPFEKYGFYNKKFR